MRKFTAPIFDDYILGTTTIWYTTSAYNELLGSADDLVVQAVTEEVTGTGPGLVIQPTHSCNGLDWLLFPGNLVTGIVNDGTYLADSAFFVGATFLTFVRFQITLTGLSPACRLKLFACGRVSANAVQPVAPPTYSQSTLAPVGITMPMQGGQNRIQGQQLR